MSTKSFMWKNVKWIAEGRKGAPGPNTYNTANVFLKNDGLHLRIDKVNGVWRCATVKTAVKLGFGEYKCVVKGPLALDKNMVFGFFNYGSRDGIDEVDIEISKWGDKTYPPLGYTVYPSVPGPNDESPAFPMDLTALESTHTFTWGSDGVSFLSITGNQQFSWKSPLAPGVPLNLYFDLWLMLGRTPSNGKGTEIVIKDFSFKPLTQNLEFMD
jgi:hypothetical protein